MLMHCVLATAEKRVLTEQAERSGKPANIIERMVAGRLHKVMLAHSVVCYCVPFVRLFDDEKQHGSAKSYVCTLMACLCCIEALSDAGVEEGL